jgi:integrase
MKVNNDKATDEWLSSQKRGTRSTYQTAWKYFIEYAGMNGDRILESRKNDKDFAWEKRVLRFKRWMTEEKRQSDNTAKTGTTAVRSFFAYHRMPLEFRKTEKEKLTEAKRKFEDYRFNREDLKKMADVSDLVEKYVIIAGKSFGLRAGDFLRLRCGDLEPYINREPPISIGEYSTEKESVKAFPFIDADAKPVIQLMLEKLNREGRVKPSDKMLSYKDAIQLSRIIRRAAKKAGINYGDKQVRFHCLRKFLCDHLSSHMSSEKWKQIVGKTIKEGAYVSADSLREDYQRTMAETCFTKAIKEEEIEFLAEKKALEMAAKLMNISDEHRKKMLMRKIDKAKTHEELDKVAEEIRKGREDTKTNTDGGWGRQKTVGEDELEGYLAKGWRATMTLPSGKIVIENA